MEHKFLLYGGKLDYLINYEMKENYNSSGNYIIFQCNSII